MNFLALVPAVLMALFGCATLILDVVSPRAQGEPRENGWILSLNVSGQILIAYSFVRQWQALRLDATGGIVALQGAITIDALSLFTNAVVWLAVAVLLAISYRYLEIVREHRGEYYALAVFAQCGMYLMASAVDLIALFIGLELTALSFYILVGFTRADRRSNEAALKYLLLGALSSGFVLYGFSLLYGATGSTELADISTVVAQSRSSHPSLIVATVAIVVGLLFKVSAAPFHTWAPDAYDGAPTPITGYLSVASKVASFAVLIRLLSGPLAAAQSSWKPLLSAIAVASLTIGSIAAITQDRLKRLFAYSGIAHAGYLLLGFVAGSPLGAEGIYVYLLVYAIMNLGAFSVLTALRRRGISGDYVSDLRGLSQTYPAHAALFAILLLSLAGIPPTAGFIAKYFIFAALIQTHHITLAITAAAYVVVSLYYYFRLVREMYLEPVEQREPLAASTGVRFALTVTASLTLLLGLFPEPVLTNALLVAGVRR
ncbi:MAG: NADH-quinone oxidoreductase subunit N [Acidobacteriaceae bacterium]|nr:NADH-quinone oxidoreductase subunit N [Acidobacteriaceae bacterium]